MPKTFHKLGIQNLKNRKYKANHAVVSSKTEEK